VKVGPVYKKLTYTS